MKNTPDYNLRNNVILIICILSTYFFSNKLLACKYNVRETGFADFGQNQYHLYGFVNRQMADDPLLHFKDICLSSFENSNIVHEILNVDSLEDHLAFHYIKQNNIKSYPSAVLVSPDSQVFVIRFQTSSQLSKSAIKSNLDRIVNSTVRRKIIDSVINYYGVILVIKGPSNSENKRALECAKQAIQTIKKQMKLMPKSIKHPPELIILERENLQDEEILLWSLSLDYNLIDDSYAVIIYGKARWIGPLLKGEEITKTNLTNILQIIGMDCECGLDMQVLQGTMLPVKWDDKTKARLVSHLGFDPENPLVKLEINRILRKGLSHSPGVPMYYQSPRTSKNQDDPLYVVDDESYLTKPLYLLGFLSLIVVISGVFIILKKRRN
jgi:hypothetical protein